MKKSDLETLGSHSPVAAGNEGGYACFRQGTSPPVCASTLPICSHAWPLWAFEFKNLFEIFRLVCSMGDSSWDFDTLCIFKEEVYHVSPNFNGPSVPRIQWVSIFTTIALFAFHLPKWKAHPAVVRNLLIYRAAAVNPHSHHGGVKAYMVLFNTVVTSHISLSAFIFITNEVICVSVASVTFQVFNGPMWLLASILDSADV